MKIYCHNKVGKLITIDYIINKYIYLNILKEN